jgi:hypothetical protein
LTSKHYAKIFGRTTDGEGFPTGKYSKLGNTSQRGNHTRLEALGNTSQPRITSQLGNGIQLGIGVGLEMANFFESMFKISVSDGKLFLGEKCPEGKQKKRKKTTFTVPLLLLADTF